MKPLALLVSTVPWPLAVLADVSPDPISGGAGWVGAGLLGAVLSWLLLVYLPGKDKQLERFIEAKDKQLAARDVEVAAMRATFEEESERQRKYHDRKTTEMQGMIVELARNFRVAVHDMRDTGQVVNSQAQLVTQTAKAVIDKIQPGG